jgi:translation initiation factor 6
MIAKATYRGKVSIGVFSVATDEFVLVPEGAEKLRRAVENALEVKAIEASVASSPLLGIYAMANTRNTFLPFLADEEEIEGLKDHDPVILEERYVALGNLISVNDTKAVISPLVSKETEKQLKDTGLEVLRRTIGGHEVTGACIVLTNKGFVTSPDVSEDELKELEKDLNLHGEATTVNMGSPYVSSGIVANSQGVLVGLETTTVEIVRIDQSLVM